MRVLGFVGTWVTVVVVAFVAVMVVFGWMQIRPGPAVSGDGPVDNTPVVSPAEVEPASQDWQEQAAAVVRERSGSACARYADVLFGPNAPLSEQDDLDASISAAGGVNRWLFADAAARRARPAWIGDLQGAARAFGGELVATSEKVGWIIVERGAGIVAIELRRRDGSSGVSIWWPANEIQSVACPPG